MNLRRLIESVYVTLKSIGPVSILKSIFIFIFSLLGMNLFAGELKFDKNGNVDKHQGKSPRSNFDNFL